jgi:hypothetical protein
VAAPVSNVVGYRADGALVSLDCAAPVSNLPGYVFGGALAEWVKLTMLRTSRVGAEAKAPPPLMMGLIPREAAQSKKQKRRPL